MSAKNRARKAAAKGYFAAGQIYWTRDMEDRIRAIHKSRKTWRASALIGYGVAILIAVAWMVFK